MGEPFISPVVPSGAVLCTRRALFRRSGAVPVCFAEAAGGSSVGEQRGGGGGARGACAGVRALARRAWRAMADRIRDVPRAAWYATNRCIAASTSDQVLAPAGLFANRSSRSAGHCTGIAASQSTSVGSSRSTKARRAGLLVAHGVAPLRRRAQRRHHRVPDQPRAVHVCCLALLSAVCLSVFRPALPHPFV